MILESLKSAPAKVIHIFDLSKCDGRLKPQFDERTKNYTFHPKNEFKVGRSVESDMKIADISVSRVHSLVRFEGNRLFITDNGSKFGTMVRVNKPHPVMEMKNNLRKNAQGLTVANSAIYQIGRSILYFKMDNYKAIKVNNEDIPEEQTEGEDNELKGYSRWKGTVFNRKIRMLKKQNLDPKSGRVILDDNMIPSEFMQPLEVPQSEEVVEPFAVEPTTKKEAKLDETRQHSGDRLEVSQDNFRDGTISDMRRTINEESKESIPSQGEIQDDGNMAVIRESNVEASPRALEEVFNAELVIQN